MAFRIPEHIKQNLFLKGKFFVNEINFEVINQLINWILENRPKKKLFTVVINSSGGSPQAVIYFASFAATLSKDVKLEGVAFGECGSAALALLQCCTKRSAVNHCGFFIHHLHFKLNVNCQSYNLETIKMEILDSQATERELVQLQCQRTGISESDWKKLADEGETVDNKAILPEEALQHGLIDEIIDQYELF